MVGLVLDSCRTEHSSGIRRAGGDVSALVRDKRSGRMQQSIVSDSSPLRTLDRDRRKAGDVGEIQLLDSAFQESEATPASLDPLGWELARRKLSGVLMSLPSYA